MSEDASALDRFTSATRRWFDAAFDRATPAQLGAWNAVSAGQNALVIAPTGSGKTLAAFLWALDGFIRRAAEDAAGPGVQAVPSSSASSKKGARKQAKTKVLYISPLKALGVDVERNLRAPLLGIGAAASHLGVEVPEIQVGLRTGDTPATERRRLVTNPPDILITTPESLFLMLTSKARASLAGVETVILDEVHAVASTKRGAHLALSLERLDALLEAPAQRIGLSATVEPADEVARFLGGSRPVTVVRPASEKAWDLQVRVPVEDMTALPGAGDVVAPDPELTGPGGGHTTASIWPFVESEIVDVILANRSTIVFVNSRRTAERLTGSLNEIYATRMGWDDAGGTDGAGGANDGSAKPEGAENEVPEIHGPETHGPEFSRAHHGSMSKEERALVEDALKSGALRCVVATSSLELGIDMGSVDAVIQVEAPPSVASSLQRVGRAGHQVGEVSTGVFLPKHRADLAESAVVVERMRTGALEPLRVPANPLDILAQHIVAAAAMDELDVEQWFELVRRSAPFASLPETVFESVLDLLAGKYPSDEFAELRPRVVWDREAGTVTGRPGAQRLAVTSGGTIPDRGLFGVFLAGSEDDGAAGTARTGGKRVGELDEEMVYESRVGEVIILGATSWQIQDITHDRVLVTPAFGQPGRLPFWRGEAEGRPVELGQALGRFRAELGAAIGSGSVSVTEAINRVPAEVLDRLDAAGLDTNAKNNLLGYLAQQLEATGKLPTDTQFVVERFPDELGDWRVILHSPLGNAVHGPWALAVGARLEARYGFDASAMAADDGIVLRIPATDDTPPGAELFLFDPDELEETVRAQVSASALFASRFRENAARALLLPRRDPGRRMPLWQQRQRAAQLLAVASKHPQFPIILETAREVLQDVYDLPRLRQVMTAIQAAQIRVAEVETRTGSPFAQNLLFGYTAQFLYEPDAPLAERRAAALSLDSTLLAQLLGTAELRELLDAEVITQVEAELQRTAPDRRAHGAEGVADLLRVLGPLTPEQLLQRLRSTTDTQEPASPQQVSAWTQELLDSKRALKVRMNHREVFAAVEDAARLRDGLGVPLPMGIPSAFIEPVAQPLEDLVSRFARTHGPFTVQAAAEALGLGTAVVHQVLHRLHQEGRVSSGAFLPAELQDKHRPAEATEWCDAEVLRRIRRRSLAALRAEVESVDQAAFARYLVHLHHMKPPRPRTPNQMRGGTQAPAPEQFLIQPGLNGVDGVAEALDQLAGFPAPASAWENYILPARVADFSPHMLDQVLATGEFVMAGTQPGTGNDGWLAFHHQDTVDLTLPVPPASVADDFTAVHRGVLEVLAGTGAWFFPELVERVKTVTEPGTTQDQVLDALWDLLWAGLVTNDSFVAIRAGLSTGSTAHKPRAHAPRSQRRTRSSRLARLRRMEKFPLSTDRLPGHSPETEFPEPAPGRAAGRWSLVPQPHEDPTLRSHAQAEYLLDRYGVITRGSVSSEQLPGGFGLYYRLLSRMEEAGQVRRGYFIESLGAAQFSTAATIDALRSFQPDPAVQASHEEIQARAASLPRVHPVATQPGFPPAVALAATDPANPYGAALPWPELDTEKLHRPGRKAGAVVVLVDGELALYMERGGRTLLDFLPETPDTGLSESGLSKSGRADTGQTTPAHRVAATALAQALTRGRVSKLAMESRNGQPITGTPLATALLEAGFYSSPSGLRFRTL